ncbi:MAG: ABC transporter permease [Bacteroidales bacterium]|nr:ABC transporter permease [Bacteroidales bacterium]
MNTTFFISRRLRFKGGLAMVCIAVSYLVMIIAVSVSNGFRSEIRGGLSALSGDVQITPPDLNVLDQSRPIEADASYIPYIQDIDAVAAVTPAVYLAGIVRQDADIYGLMFKGVPGDMTGVSIPRGLADRASLKEGDDLTAYFVGEKVRARKFEVTSVYDSMLETDGRIVVHADMADLQRLCGWSENQVSALEITLKDRNKDEEGILEAARQIGYAVNAYSEESDAPVIATSSISRFPQLFDWLDLIDFNVLFILILMTIVAGFNMISGLLIMLFENISTIGLFKALGMSDRSISKVFLSRAAWIVFKGMAVGNLLAFAFAMIQNRTHLLKLDPSNYFVPYVPVKIDAGSVLLADIGSFVAIMLLLLIPTLFISKVDPAQTVRMK